MVEDKLSYAIRTFDGSFLTLAECKEFGIRTINFVSKTKHAKKKQKEESGVYSKPVSVN